MTEFAEKAQARREAENTSGSRAKSKLPSDPPEQDVTTTVLAAWTSIALGLGGETAIDSAVRYGRHLDARMVLTLRSGQRVTFDRQGDIFEPRKLTQNVIAATGATIPHYQAADAQKIATALIRMSDLAAEDDDRAEAHDWADTFLAAANRNTIDVASFTSPEGRWEALTVLTNWKTPDDLPHWAEPAERAVIIRDGTGRRLVRVNDVGAHVRGQSGRPIPWPSLHSRMVEIGWEHRGQIQQRNPNGTGKLKARVFAIPADWDDQ